MGQLSLGSPFPKSTPESPACHMASPPRELGDCPLLGCPPVPFLTPFSRQFEKVGLRGDTREPRLGERAEACRRVKATEEERRLFRQKLRSSRGFGGSDGGCHSRGSYGQALGEGSAGQLLLGVSRESHQMSPGPLAAGRLTLAVPWGHGVSPHGCSLGALIAWPLTPPTERPRWTLNHLPWPSLGVTVTSSHCGRRPHKFLKTRRPNPGAALEMRFRRHGSQGR